MKVGILTSSGDYGIYLPLLQKMKSDSIFLEMEIIAFGTHLSKNHGYTVRILLKDEYTSIHTISSLISNDDAQSILHLTA
jgi:GDP/UDP-N,N'-diacetylbacillosamine 2-epimerase (hydrolysing)